MKRLAALLAIAALAAPAAAFDRVLLKDGRSIECTVLESKDPAIVRIKVRSVEVPIRAELVDKTWIENLENYVPKNDQEKDYLKKGLVLFEGSWMSTTRRDQELKKRADADKAYIEDQKKRQDWKNAVTIQTLHFEVKSNLDDATLKMYTDSLEAYYKNFMDYWGITLSPTMQKLKPKIYIYRTIYDYWKDNNVPPGVVGFFRPGDMDLHLFHEADRKYGSLPTLFHEGNHLLTYLMSPNFFYPTWMNEGMAEYYGTAHLDAQGKFTVGSQQDGRIVDMRQQKADGKFRKLADVLSKEQQDYDVYDYAYGWSFTHFLMTSPKYSSAYRGFFANLPSNKDIHIKTLGSLGPGRGSIGAAPPVEVMHALEKRLGKSVDELEAEWLKYYAEAYSEIGPEGYYDAARLALRQEGDSAPDVTGSMGFFQKAVDLGIKVASCYREYAEMLRVGGMREGNEVHTPFKPDPDKAWTMAKKAIELDPIDPENYLEAGADLVMDGPQQDLDKAADYAAAAIALAGPRNSFIKFLANDLMARIEPARAKKTDTAKATVEAAKTDARRWVVAFFFVQGATPPDNLKDLSTQQLRDLIRTGKVGADDNIFQSWRNKDPKTGELVPGTDPWDAGWVKVKDCPLFKDELAAAPKAGGSAPGAPPGGSVAPPAPPKGSPPGGG